MSYKKHYVNLIRVVEGKHGQRLPKINAFLIDPLEGGRQVKRQTV